MLDLNSVITASVFVLLFASLGAASCLKHLH